MPAEQLTSTERAAFIAQFLRLGETRVASMLEVWGVRRFSDMGRVRRLEFLEKLKSLQK